MWTDASGAARWMAAVVVIGSEFRWTRWRCTDEIWCLLQEREDNQIGVQETMAVILGLFSWQSDLNGAAITIYVDNEGATYALISETSKCQEVSLLAARMWHEAAQNKRGTPL